MEAMSLLPILAGVAAFGMVAAIWTIGVIVYYLVKRGTQTQLRQRMGIEANDMVRMEDTRMLQLWRDGSAVPVLVPDVPDQPGKLQVMVDTLGLKMPPYFIVLAIGLVSLMGFLLTVALMQDLILSIGVAVALAMAPWMYLQGQVKRQRMKFDTQLSDALSVAARSLRAGHPISGAFELISEEVAPPVRDVFAELVQQQSLGMSLEEAVMKTANRIGNPDLKLFAASIVIQVRSGGNLADTMEKLSNVIHDRIRLARRSMALTAQVQLSKRILVAVPFATALFIHLLNRDYMRPLFVTTEGRMLLGIAAVLLLIGVWMMNKMSNLEY
jgi:tight adherence protein B